MAAPTYSDIWTYAHSVHGVSQKARDAFLEAAEAVDFSDWASAAEQLREITLEIVDVYGLAAGELGAQWYEFCRAKKYGSSYTAVVGQVSRYSVKASADAVIDKMFDGKIGAGAVVGQLAGVVADQVQRKNRDVIFENLYIEYNAAVARGDRKTAAQIGYARVPQGNACAFCIMLASRGFVYTSEHTATRSRGGGKYHEHCTCEAVPFTRADEIAGYSGDFGKYNEMYDDARAMWKSGSMPEELEQRIADAKAEHAEKMANGQAWDRWGDDNEIAIVMRWQNPGLH